MTTGSCGDGGGKGVCQQRIRRSELRFRGLCFRVLDDTLSAIRIGNPVERISPKKDSPCFLRGLVIGQTRTIRSRVERARLPISHLIRMRTEFFRVSNSFQDVSLISCFPWGVCARLLMSGPARCRNPRRPPRRDTFRRLALAGRQKMSAKFGSRSLRARCL
jgi:hypothetical protein